MSSGALASDALARSTRCIHARFTITALASIAALGAGCKSSDERAKSAPAPVATPAKAAPATPSPAHDATPATGDSDAEYVEALREGRSLAKNKEWAAASAAFELALAARPNDPRAASELGWSAIHTGDLERARKANEIALASPNPKLRAASHYNLGRIAEKEGNLEEALRHYRRSLYLRNHRGVAKLVAKLSKEACEGPTLQEWEEHDPAVTLQAACAEIVAEQPDEPPSCESDVHDNGTYATVTSTLDGEEFVTVYVPRGEKWVALFGTYSSGRGYSEELTSLVKKAVGGKDVYVIDVLRSDDMHDVEDSEPTEDTWKTVCVDEPARSRCFTAGGYEPTVDASGKVTITASDAKDPCSNRTYALW